MASPLPVPAEVARKALTAFETLRDLPEDERSREREAIDDPRVRAEVDRLFEADSRRDSLATPSPTRLAEWLAAPEAIDLAEAQVGSCRIGRRIADGGMGRVYEATQSPPGRQVAVKILRQALPDEHARRRFEEEARVLGAIEHPGVCRIYEAGVWRTAEGESLPYFAMELVADARPLTRFADDTGLDVAGRVALVRTVCDAVAAIHAKGVIHRDLKPGNVLVDRSGRPVVIDFGIARATGVEGAPQTQAGTVLGTPSYMAPEQVVGRSEDVDVRSDVYALGVILYELLTRHLPRDLGDGGLVAVVDAMRSGTTTPVEAHAPSLPRDLRAVVSKALEADPTRRYASVAELAADLDRWRDRRPVLARPSSAARKAGLWLRRNAVPAGLLTAVVASLVVAAWVARQSATRERELRETADRQLRRADDLLTRTRSLYPWLVGVHAVRVAGLPGGRPVGLELADGIRTHLDALALDQVEDLGVLNTAASTYLRLANLNQGTGERGYGLGRPADAERDMRRSIALARRSQSILENSAAAFIETDGLKALIGRMIARGDLAEADVRLAECLAAFAIARRLAPDDLREDIPWAEADIQCTAAALEAKRGAWAAERTAAKRALDLVSAPFQKAVPYRLAAGARVHWICALLRAPEPVPLDALLAELDRISETAAKTVFPVEVWWNHYNDANVIADRAQTAGRPELLSLLARAERCRARWAAASPGDRAPARENVALAMRTGFVALITGSSTVALERCEAAISAAGTFLEGEPDDRFVHEKRFLARLNASEACLRLGRAAEHVTHLEAARASVAEIARRFPATGLGPQVEGYLACEEADLDEIRAESAADDASRKALWRSAIVHRRAAIERLGAAAQGGADAGAMRELMGQQEHALRSLEQRAAEVSPPR